MSRLSITRDTAIETKTFQFHDRNDGSWDVEYKSNDMAAQGDDFIYAINELLNAIRDDERMR